MSNAIKTPPVTSGANYTWLQLHENMSRPSWQLLLRYHCMQWWTKQIYCQHHRDLHFSPHARCQITREPDHHSWRQLFSTHAVSDKTEDMRSRWSFFLPLLLLSLPSLKILELECEMTQWCHCFEPQFLKSHWEQQQSSQWDPWEFYF